MGNNLGNHLGNNLGKNLGNLGNNLGNNYLVGRVSNRVVRPSSQLGGGRWAAGWAPLAPAGLGWAVLNTSLDGTHGVCLLGSVQEPHNTVTGRKSVSAVPVEA